MVSFNILYLALMVTSASAIIANFDQNNINLANYQSANFANFTVTGQYQRGGGPGQGGIPANTPPNYVDANGKTSQYGSAAATLFLNAHSQYGHLNSFYFACYTPLSFVPNGNPCNFTMTARCLDKNNNQNTFTYLAKYTAPNSTMQYVDLAPFYQFYANMGFFAGVGAGARCFRYDFVSVPEKAGNNQLTTGFFLDTANYTVTV